VVAAGGQTLELDIGNVAALLQVGKVLSAIALAVVLLIIVNIWRRPSFPAVSYGSIRLSHGRMRWLWFTFILGSLALGSAADPAARLENTSEDAELLAAAESTRHTGFTMPFPFYRYERQLVYADGVLAVDNTYEGFLIPWGLLSAFLAYLVLVIRWNPENRLALRILRGRQRRRGRRSDP